MLKISIITVVYNAILTIEQTIKSVLVQTYPNIEYIIIDGGSNDGTLDVIRRYKDRLSHFISESDQGLYDAMNKGISLAKGDIVGFINADDWYEINAVEQIANYFENTCFDVVYGDVCIVSLNGEKKRNVTSSIDELWYHMVISHPSAFVRRSLFSLYGKFDTNYKIAADYEWMLRCYTHKAKFKYVNQIIANFRMGGLSTTDIRRCHEEARNVSLKYIDKSPNRCETLRQLKKFHMGAEFELKIRKEPQCVYDLFKSIDVSFDGKIVIWGSGIWGEKLLLLQKDTRIKILFFIDKSLEKQGCFIDGIEIKNPDAVLDYKGFLLIAIRNKGDEIERQLLDKYNLKYCITIDKLMQLILEDNKFIG